MDLNYSTLEITTKIGCPVACSYCPQDKTVKAYKDKNTRVMSLETFNTCIDKIPITINPDGTTNPRIEFAGFSEPFVSPDAADMMVSAYDKGFTDMTLFTTFKGMTMEDFEKIKHIPFSIFSIHLPDKEGIVKVKIDEHYLILLKLCLDTFVEVSFYISGEVKDEVMGVIKSYDYENMYWHDEVHSRAGNVDGVEPVPRLEGQIHCSASNGMALNHGVLLPNGDVALCCMDFGLKHIKGNLLTGEYIDLFKSSEHNKVVAGMYVDDGELMCRICNYARPNK